MSKKVGWKFVGWVIALAIVLLAVFLVLSAFQPSQSELSEKSVVFYSSDSPVLNGLEQLAKKDNFLLVAQFQEPPSTNQYVANAMNLFSVTMIGNNKKTTNLFMVDSPTTGKLVLCRTNYGDPSRDEELAPDACRAFLKDFTGPKVTIFWPDTNLSRGEVLVSANAVEIHPYSNENASLAAYSTLKKMYPNVDEIVGNVNSIAQQLH